MTRILIVEDEESYREPLVYQLTREGYDVSAAATGEEGLELFTKGGIDLVLLDLMLPGLDGTALCRRIREQSRVPIIMLTAKSAEIDKVVGLEIGADDYVTKPFSPKEVMARINAVTKRRAMKNNDASQQSYKFEGLEIDMAGRNVYVDGEKAELTPKEYELLFYLVRNKGIALTREKLLYDVWGFDFYGDDRTVDTHIKMLRGNLKEYRKFIVTLRGLGYKFEV